MNKGNDCIERRAVQSEMNKFFHEASMQQLLSRAWWGTCTFVWIFVSQLHRHQKNGLASWFVFCSKWTQSNILCSENLCVTFKHCRAMCLDGHHVLFATSGREIATVAKLFFTVPKQGKWFCNMNLIQRWQLNLSLCKHLGLKSNTWGRLPKGGVRLSEFVTHQPKDHVTILPEG